MRDFWQGCCPCPWLHRVTLTQAATQTAGVRTGVRACGFGAKSGLRRLHDPPSISDTPRSASEEIYVFLGKCLLRRVH